MKVMIVLRQLLQVKKMKTENIKKILNGNIYFIENEELKNIETEIWLASGSGDKEYLRAMRLAHRESKQIAKTLRWVRDLFDKPQCFMEPNEMCSASHPETDEDCPELKECLKAFDAYSSLHRTVKGDPKDE